MRLVLGFKVGLGWKDVAAGGHLTLAQVLSGCEFAPAVGLDVVDGLSDGIRVGPLVVRSDRSRRGLKFDANPAGVGQLSLECGRDPL